MNQQDFTVQLLRNAYADKGYEFFENGDFNLNIFGVRNSTRESGRFDDFIGVAYKDKGQWIVRAWKATTDAGTHWLVRPMNKKGTALLVPEQYRKCWKLGLHKGEYEALVQQKPMKVYRDNDKDRILDLDASTIDEGLFGINCHRSNPRFESQEVDRWSAGCQVFMAPIAYANFMALVKKSASIYGDEFTYTLFDQVDFSL